MPELTYAAPSAALEAYLAVPREYVDAGHSFMNRINVGPLFAPVMRFAGLDYRHDSAQDAWRRILDFFDEHLGAPAPG